MRRFMALLVVGASLCLGGSAMAATPSCAPAAPVACTAPVVTTSCCVRVRHHRHRVCRTCYRHHRHHC